MSMISENKSQISMCRTTTGMGNVIGNATSVVREFIKGLFPKDFFKDEYIDTEMVLYDIIKEDIVKKKKPCLVIRPKISLEDDSLFQKLPDWMNTNYFVFKTLKGNYCPVLYDDENQIYMYCSGDRVRLSYEIEIIVDSKLQQLNTAYFLKHSVIHKGYFYLSDTRMETEIPKYFMKQISILMNKDLTISEERAEFNNYINEHSQKFIEEKVKLASGNFSHFYLFKTNILSIFPNYPDIDDGKNEGKTSDDFKISETFDIEFWCPMTYFLEIGNKIKFTRPKDYNYLEDFENKVSLNYTLTFPIPEKYNDMDYHNKIMYLTDDNPKSDTVDISSLFTHEDYLVIKFAKEHRILISEIFHIDLYLDNYKVENESIIIDWDKFELKNIRPKINDCYTLVLYKSIERYNRTRRVINHIEGNNYN